jgi:hypothetical protein
LWHYNFSDSWNGFPAKKNPGLSRGFLRCLIWSLHSSPAQKTPGPSRRLRRRLRRRMFLQAMAFILYLIRMQNRREYDKRLKTCQAKTDDQIFGSQI